MGDQSFTSRIEQIRHAHVSAKPNPYENPSWFHAEKDIGELLAEVDRLRAVLDKICMKGRNPIAEAALGLTETHPDICMHPSVVNGRCGICGTPYFGKKR